MSDLYIIRIASDIVASDTITVRTTRTDIDVTRSAIIDVESDATDYTPDVLDAIRRHIDSLHHL